MDVTVCPSCAASSPEGARFCPACGWRLNAGRGATGVSERRIITTLFCDLIDFASLSDQVDPEDVDSLLRPYYALARQVIEQYGGVVKKSVGDAVVGVFGVHKAHEDDAERAVRAAVRLQERNRELPHTGGPRPPRRHSAVR